VEDEFLVLINNYRQQNNLPLLEKDQILTLAATWMAEDMLNNCVATRSDCDHTDSTGRTFGQRLDDFGYNYGAGENIAWGWGRALTAQAAFDLWKNSPGHNENMLRPSYRAIGIARRCNGGDCAWVNNFGTRVVQPLTPVSSDPPCTDCTRYSGTAAEQSFEPDGNYYFAESAGIHSGWLRGSAGSNLNLYLWYWNGTEWLLVDVSENSTSSEQISYDGEAGYYVWMVVSEGRGGSYNLWLTIP
jgi:hypothetical protein